MWNLPNLLTVTRVMMIPVFVGASLLPGKLGLIAAACCFGFAAFTDWADGYVARRRRQLTHFGRFFDPVADKLLVVSALVLLVYYHRAPLVLVLVIVAREITIMGLREFMSGLGAGVPVSRVGKWKTGFQLTAIIMLLLQDGLDLIIPIDFGPPGVFCLYMATFFTLWSGAQYMAAAWPQIRDSG